jgi:glucokinase
MNDPIAKEAFITTGDYLGRLLANTVAAFDPEMVILSGGLANAKELLLEPTRKSFEQNAPEWHRDSVEITSSMLHNAAILGASYLVPNAVQKQDADFLPAYKISHKTDVIVS